MHAARRSMVAAVAAVAGLAMVPAASLAQAQDAPAPDTVRVRMSTTGVHAPDTLAAGRYRLAITAPRRSPGLLQLVKPDRGYTRAEFRADLRRPGTDLFFGRRPGHVRLFGGAMVRPGGTGALWETLYAGRYWLLAFRWDGVAITTVRVHGTPAPTRFPRVVAHATGTDTGLRLERRIPRAGRMLVRNTSARVDTQLMIPLAAGATYADFLRWVRHPRRAPMPLRFGRARLTAALSPDAAYVLRYRLHPGHYVVFGLSSLNADRVRQVFQPLTVPEGSHARARSSLSWRSEGLRTAPRLTRRIQQWAATGGRDTAPPMQRLSGLRRLVARVAASTPR